MALGKAMHILAFVYYCGCVGVDLSFDFHADPTHGRTYYCVFRQGSLEAVMKNWTWKHYYVIFAFVVLGPAQMIALIAKLCRRKGGPYDALTLLLSCVSPSESDGTPILGRHAHVRKAMPILGRHAHIRKARPH